MTLACNGLAKDSDGSIKPILQCEAQSGRADIGKLQGASLLEVDRFGFAR